jgi:mono/diheme cytochrome c family protein
MHSKPSSRRPAPSALLTLCGVAAALFTWAGASLAAAPKKPVTTGQTKQSLEARFTTQVRPFLATYCVSCHGKVNPQAQLDLSAYTSVSAAAADYPHLALMMERLEAKQMPPPSRKQPTAAEREAVIAWVRGLKQWEAERNAGDPGLVLARRLSNSEYDYTIRDLCGADIRPTKEFPVDPANQEGFDNSGESLTISPALMKKYLAAAREVADHMALGSTGISFATHPVLVETDRDKYCILRIIDFYKRQPTDYADYFQAAWKFKNRAALGTPQATLASVAEQSRVSPRYLELIWNTLDSADDKVGPVSKLREKFNALPAPGQGNAEKVREDCEAMRDWVKSLRKKLEVKFDNLRTPGFSPGGQWNLLWKDKQFAQSRRECNLDELQIDGVGKTRTVTPRRRNGQDQEPQQVQDPANPDLFAPKDEPARAPYVASFKRFCSVFPTEFYIPERGRMEFFDPGDRGRLLSAGFHNMMGYFRDDTPLSELILDEAGRKELDRLWTDFDVVAQVPERMHLEFIFYERAEAHTITDHAFDFAKSEDKTMVTEAGIQHLAQVYLEKARRMAGNPSTNSPALQAMEDYFKNTNANIRAVQKIRAAAEPAHLNALLDFARRAYRRPLAPAERDSLIAFYRNEREKENVSHEDAMRDCIVSVLMSPNFLFRVDQASADETPAKAQLVAVKKPAAPAPDNSVQPLSDYALASRLSYFLWSSMPDDELLSHAGAGDLHKPEVLSAQARRMLKDPRARALAVEWGGNWLDFRRFEEHQAVDRQRFPVFNDDVRESMFEEPIRFLTDLFQNGSVLDALYGKYTFVNNTLARYYHMDDVKPAGKEWVRVPNADKYGRGGLLPMGVFLTKNSPGLRTSPVKRGYWVVKRVLGEQIPPPPATVPELPKDEGQLGDRTLRQALEQHRQNPACAGCHARFDSFGLVFENYGPVGELRTKDLGGKAVDTNATFPNGTDHQGLDGLKDYIRQQRQKDFIETLTRKLLSYALGRTLLPSDDPTLAQMQARLAAGGYRFQDLVDSIVTSRQFRTRRVSVALAKG